MKIIEALGNTPIVEVENYKGVTIYAKLEYYNPSGSVKDRAAYYIIKKAREAKFIKKGATIIEGTSGNTGIALAFIAKRLGYKCIIVMPENMTAERRNLIKAYGAEIVLTPKDGGMMASVEMAKKIAMETENSFVANQFENENNSLAHYETTAPEIFKEIPDIDCIVAGFGTGGTVSGIKQYIIDNKLNTKVAAIEPYESALLTKGKAGAHQIGGIGANFIPKIFKHADMDMIRTVKSEDAKNGARKLAYEHGILAGVSGGASYMAARDIVDLGLGLKKILFIVPDNGMKYISMGLYD